MPERGAFRLGPSSRCTELSLMAFLVLGLIAEPASASPDRSKTKVRFDGHDRIDYVYMTSFPVDESGALAGRPGAGSFFHRVRASAELSWKKWRIVAEGDFGLYSHLYPFHTELGERFSSPIKDQADSFPVFLPRKCYAEWESPAGMVQFGLMPSHWGMGMVAGSGDRPSGEFDLPWYGDRMVRAGIITPFLRPLTRKAMARKLMAAAYLDLVYLDENASVVDKDWAFQAVMSLFYRDPERIFGGVYFTVRRQKDHEDTFLNAVVLDLFFQMKRHVSKGWLDLELSVETAMISGRTDRVVTEESPRSSRILSFGAVARAKLSSPRLRLSLSLDGGYASGDNDPSDGTVRQFSFDPDFSPSLILFRYVLGAVTARGADRASDPGLVGTPAQGLSQYPTYGAIRGALFVMPVLKAKPFQGKGLLRGVTLKAGFLYAVATSDPVDPYNSFREGGVNMTHMRLPSAGRRELGYELNTAVEYNLALYKSLRLDASVMYGHFFPGKMFKSSNGKREAVDMVAGRLLLLF